ncbi:MAG TPA: restriction endonuclease subunit S [Bradyrhizobium sp.]|jgi:type I restriction enzyme S subunit
MIDEFCETGSGGTPSRANGDYYGGNIPWVKSGELREDVITDTEEKITARAIKESSAKIVPSGAILLAMYGATVGRMAFLGIDAATNQAVCNIRPDPKKAFPRYVFHCLQSKINHFLGRAAGGAQPNISQGIIRETKIPLPPLDEQRRIAAILDKADALRRKRQRTIGLHDNLAQSIFLEMFGDPRSNPKGFKTSGFEPLLKTSPNFGSMIPPKIQEAEWVSLRVANIQNWKLALEDSKYIDLPSDSVEKHTLLDGDIILARAIASEEHLGKCVVVKPAGRKWAFDSHLMRIRLNTEMIYPVYVRELFKTPGGRQLFLQSTRKTTVQYNINTKELKALKIPVPPIALQQEFVSRVDTLDSIQDSGRRSTRYLDQLFSSLQSRAFSGQL